MIISFNKKIICNNELDGNIKCSDNIINKLKIKFPDLKLKAETKADKVNGFIEIFHSKENSDHVINIILYDKNGKDHNDKKHERALKYNKNFPSKEDFKNSLS